jgi:hypothetical protein
MEGCVMELSDSKRKNKIYSVTCHEGIDWKQRIGYTLSLTTAAISPRMSNNPFLGGSVSLISSLDGCGNPVPTGIRTFEYLVRSELLYQLHYLGA